ncbi:DNA alkylation repair protein [Pedobacter sp. PWIIR3]
MAYLQDHGSESIKKILLKHGVKEPFFGVKIEFLKTIEKKIKVDYQLAKELYATGNADAQYLAGLIADDKKMSREDLQTWVEQAYSKNIAEYTVPWVAAGSNFGYELATTWIASANEDIAASGWSTLSNVVALKQDAELDIAGLKTLLDKVEGSIHSSPNRVIYTMNGFVIAIGSYVVALSDHAMNIAKNIGHVIVDMNGTACKVPDATTYIEKVVAKGAIGKKKKTLKC